MNRNAIDAYSHRLSRRCGNSTNTPSVIARHFDVLSATKEDVLAAFGDIQRALGEAHDQMEDVEAVYAFPVLDLQKRVLFAAREIMLHQLGLTDAQWTDKP